MESVYGIFCETGAGWWALATVIAVLALGFVGAPFWAWTVLAGAGLVGFGAPLWLVAVFAVIAVIGNVKPLRAALLSGPIMRMMVKLEFLPVISETERLALDAGAVWAEGELFSGKPNFTRLMSEPYPILTPEEKAFIDGPVERLCNAVDDWQIWESREIPAAAWEIIKKERFLGMIIPKEYGGLGFSAMAHSEVIQKLASHSVAASITVMVPNSLGPAELLIHYGTDEQKRSMLPKLATGEEIPCFALTEPTAGSDAGSITSYGVLFKGDDGKLYIRLNWNKRWITLAAISTTLGLAFRLRDPDNLLGKGEDLGITCALIPSKTPGVVLGRRHDPLGVPFYNCPTHGKDVVVPMDVIVGGAAGAGKGWGMLMECLAAGRGISLPAQSVGGSKLISRVTSAHSVIRKQFGVSIGKFEAIEEPLARIAGFTYMLEAMRRYTLGAIDKGLKPAVVTAMAKWSSTEMSRRLINDGMDILGGAGISCGPRNTLAHMYIATPIGITVEGANIMTRALIIFGQGALRAHPYAYAELKAAGASDARAFDNAFWGHIGHVVRNLVRSIVLSWTRGLLAVSPVGGSVGRYYRRMSWASASFAIMADIAMGSLGGQLKQKEKITGRFADILTWMYMGTSVLRRFEADGRRKEDLPFVHYAMNHCFCEMQKAFDGLFANLTVPGVTWLFRGPIRAWSNLNAFAGEQSDQHTSKIASLIMKDSEQRLRLTDGIFVSKDPEQAVARLEIAFAAVKKAEAIERKVRNAVRSKQIPKLKGDAAAKAALDKGLITADEHAQLAKAEALRYQAIQVDDFSQAEYVSRNSSNSRELRAEAPPAPVFRAAVRSHGDDR